MKMITQTLNIYPKHTYIDWYNHQCLTILLTYQTLIFLNFSKIYETYEHVNQIILIYFHHLYMNGIQILLHCYQDQMNLKFFNSNSLN